MHNPMLRDCLSLLMRTLVNLHLYQRQKPLTPQDTEGNIQPTLMRLLATHPDEGADQNKGETSFEVDLNTNSLLLTSFGDPQALLGSEDELKDDSDDKIFKLSKDNWGKHEEAAASYADLKVVVEGFATEADNNRNNYDIAINSVMETVDQINKAKIKERITRFKALNRVSKTLEADSAMKASMHKMTDTNNTTSEDLEFNQRLLKVAEGYIQNSNMPIEIASNLKEINFPSLQARITTIENTHVIMHADISSIKGMCAREARLSKLELIKVVTEVATKAGVDPKSLQSSKAGQEFLKKQDAEIKVLNRECLEKLKKAKELRKKRINQYRWTTNSKLKPEIITNIHIHLNTKPVAITIRKNNDKRNYHVHEPFKFGDFGVTEWDELGAIIPRKKNKVVEDLMTSLSKKYDRLKVIPSELGINPTLPSCEQVLSLSLGRKRKAIQRISNIHKVDVDSLLCYMVMAGNIRTPENQKFYVRLNKMIDEHPDKEKLKSKKVKLEALGYSID
ncbi:hypothetical protein Tco_0908487 [Tanacetum coccineum]|uniref:Uncharacterized protein n=1 Tax=Tanacetum coccineum TaxID=301880 RepID=A0ABQ5CP79_9ASTR